MEICRKYVKESCTNPTCTFLHKDGICRFHYFGSCRDGATCTRSHEFRYKPNASFSRTPSTPSTSHAIHTHRKKKNTESFVPSSSPSDMNIRYMDGTTMIPFQVYPRDVLLIPNLFYDMPTVYEDLLLEMKHTTSDQVWKLWHGDSHWIADDHCKWKSVCPTFSKVMDRIQSFFAMDIKATRLNWYKDGSDWKPYHHDAAAIDEKKAKTQNLTVGVSFGDTREVSFEHATTKTKVDIELPNGMTYTFSSQVNIEWRHGIPQKMPSQGRISLIAWGWVDM